MIYIDFEFNSTTDENVNLVSCSTNFYSRNERRKFWLYSYKGQIIHTEELREYIEEHKDVIFVGWQMSAEARSFFSMGLDPVKFKFIDLFLEYRNLSNHNDLLAYGKQLVDGKVKMTKRPKAKWERTENDESTGFKQTFSLAEATYKLTGEIRDTEHKEKMREIIISNDPELIIQNKESILDYNEEDIIFLPRIHEEILNWYKKLLGREYKYSTLLKEQLYRGKYAALTGVRESKGYPINVEQTRNFSNQVATVLYEVQHEINQLFPDIKPFYWSKKDNRYAWGQIATRDWIREKSGIDISRWKLTDGGKKGNKDLSLSLEAWQRFYDFKHTYPKDNFGAQIVRFLKLKQALNGFVPGGKKNFWDAVGSDGRVRPYMNIYGSQSSRSQPGSTSYLLLKPAWTRSLLQPAPGRCITSIDYGSEEYLITALYYGDAEMVDSYISGDVYMAFGYKSGMIPPTGNKKTHKTERQVAKGCVLGISYLMSKYGLANSLTQSTGRTWTPDEAQELIDSYYDTYEDFAEGQQGVIEDYGDFKMLKFCDGWYMWGDNPNHRSVANVPIQHLGASIMREADIRCYEDGLDVPCTLHDALYIEHDYGDWSAIDKAMKHMKEAFVDHFPDQKRDAAHIRLDPFTWGPDLPAPTYVVGEDGYKEKVYSTITTPDGLEVECSDIYIDERAEAEYEKFKRYFEPREEDLL